MNCLKPLEENDVEKIRQQQQQNNDAAPFVIRYKFVNEKCQDKIELPIVDLDQFPSNIPKNWYYVCLFLETMLLSAIYQNQKDGKQIRIDCGGFIGFFDRPFSKMEDKNMISPFYEFVNDCVIVLKRIPRRQRLEKYNKIYGNRWLFDDRISMECNFAAAASSSSSHASQKKLDTEMQTITDIECLTYKLLQKNSNVGGVRKNNNNTENSYMMILPNDFTKEERNNRYVINTTQNNRICKKVIFGLPHGCIKSEMVALLQISHLISDQVLALLTVYRHADSGNDMVRIPDLNFYKNNES